MSFYHDHILPHLIGLACSQKPVMEERAKIVPMAQGRVLEIGLGAGPNLAFYDPHKVTHLYGLEPSEGMRRKARRAVAASPVPVEWLGLEAEEIPLEDDSVDTVVLTYTLCTIPGAQRALEQMRRVLKPGGALLFSEHGLAPEPGVAKWQRRIEPVWKPVAGGCHLTRPMDRLIAENGFHIETLMTAYLHGAPKFAGYNYSGTARIR